MSVLVRSRALDALAAVVVLALTLGVGWDAMFAFTNDGPQILYGAAVHARPNDPDLAFNTWVIPNDAMTSRGSDLIVGALLPHLGPGGALKGLNLLLACTAALGFWALCLALRRPWQLALVGSALAWRGTLYLGLGAYALAEGLGLFVLAAWWRPGARRAADVAGLALAMYLLARTHVFVAGLVGLALLAEAAVQGRRHALRVCVAGIPAAALAWLATGARDNHDGINTWEAAATQVHTLAAWVAPGPWWRSAGLAVLLVLSLASWREASRQHRTLAGLGALFVVASFLLPTKLLGWELGGLRPSWIGVVLLAVACPPPSMPPRLPRMRDTLALVWVAASLLWIHALNRDLANAEEPLLSDLERTRPAPHLWLAFPPPAPPRAREIPAFGPYLHLGQAFAAQLGGRAFLTQDGSREIHPVLMKPDAYPQSVILPSPEERHMMSTLAGEARASMLKSLVVRAAVSVPRLGVLVPTQDHAALADLGFRTLWTGKAMLAAEPQLCDRPIEVSGPLATIEVGVSGDAGGLLEMEVPVRASVQLPCAGVWVRVLSGCPSQSLTTGQGPVRCESPGESERARDVTGAETRQ